jgi:hypothetical protein
VSDEGKNNEKAEDARKQWMVTATLALFTYITHITFIIS